VETVCAFANAQGGTILIGVSNAGEVVGLTLGKDTLESLANRIQFFLIKFIEQWGTGTLRMIALCREAGLPEPKFAEESGALVVTFRQSRLTPAYLEEPGLSLRQIAAVEYPRAHGRITNREYVSLTGISARTAADELYALVEKRILASVGAGRARQYRLRIS